MSYWFESMDEFQVYGRTLDPNRGHLIDDRHFQIAGVPLRFRECSLAEIPEDTGHCKSLYEWARDIANKIDDGKGVLLFGAFGAGKTGAAVSLLAEALCVGAYCFFVTALELNDIYKSRDNTVQKKIEKIQFLVLDDVGAARERDFGYNKEVIEKIVRARYNNKLSTIITTNLSPGDFVKQYDAIKSIVGAEYKSIVCKGVDWRRGGDKPCLV